MKLSVLLAITTAFCASAQPLSSGSSSNRTIRAPAGRIVGTVIDDVEYYRGIPYAKPPIGPLRLRAPVRLPPSCNVIDATGIGPACPQMINIEQTPLFNQAMMTPGVADATFLGNALSEGVEDCLTLSVARPVDAPADSRLPVLYWIHGGGFELGSSQGYNASNLIPRSMEQDKPFILVTVNYRLGGFGFLGGAEVLAEGITNLGLRDQRMGLEWVADNIAAFGGDPSAVTIIGESAGAFSVFSQMALNDGDNTYKDEPLFRAAIMHSGSTASTEPVDGPLAQGVFDSVVEAAECSDAGDKIECLRSADYEKFWSATMSVPSFLSNSSLALSYAPRADRDVLTASTDVLAKQGKFANVPLIVGDTADEVRFLMISAQRTDTDHLLGYYFCLVRI
jgi:carboxylesterase type B